MSKLRSRSPSRSPHLQNREREQIVCAIPQTSVQEFNAYQRHQENSSISIGNSLLGMKYSLIGFAGNCSGNACNTGASRILSSLSRAELAKFPVSSEFRWEIWLRITASPAIQCDIFRNLQRISEKPANCGLCAFSFRLRAPLSWSEALEMPKVSGCRSEYSRFGEGETGDIVRSRLPTERSSLCLH